MKEMQFPKSNGQRFYEDVCKTIIKSLAYFDEQQLIDVLGRMERHNRPTYQSVLRPE